MVRTIIPTRMSPQRGATCGNVAFSLEWCPGRDYKPAIHKACAWFCENFAGLMLSTASLEGFLCAKSRTSFVTQTRCFGPEPGAGGGNPGAFTSLSRACLSEQCHISAICSMVKSSFCISVFPFVLCQLSYLLLHKHPVRQQRAAPVLDFVVSTF